jgi:hypothetical protein
MHVLQTLRWWSQEIEDVAWQWKVPTDTKGIQESWVEVLQLPTQQWWPQSHWDCVGRAKEAPCSKRVWRPEDWEGHLQDSLQRESVTALDFIFHPRPWATAFLFGEAGERHAKKIGKMPVKQIWALWQIGGWSQYSAFHLMSQHWVNRVWQAKTTTPPLKVPCAGAFFYYEMKSTRNEPEGIGEADLELEDK